jgi:hypothetical protein
MKFDDLKIGHLYKGTYRALFTSQNTGGVKFMWMFEPDEWALWGDETGYIDRKSWDYEEDKGEEPDLTEEIHGSELIRAIFERSFFLKVWVDAMKDGTDGKVIIT